MIECEEKASAAKDELSRRDLPALGAYGILSAGIAPAAARATTGASSQRVEAALAALYREQLVGLALDLANVSSPRARGPVSACAATDVLNELEQVIGKVRERHSGLQAHAELC